METRHYSEYFTVPTNYKANMTREAINETPDTWLDFYPHVKYQEFLETLFDESKSVWLTGNYGTGKSNAALVTHKLFMDDIERVKKWFSNYKNVLRNAESLEKRLIAERNEGTFVVYDYNASGIGPNEEFLVRLEKGIQASLKEKGYDVPANANIDLVIERLKREGTNFFTTRDQMIGEMRSLKLDIQTIDQLIQKLRDEDASSAPTHYLDDVQAVFHKDSIYLNIDVSTFRMWIKEICKRNHLKRIIYIFDEFSEFIDSNSGTLKTFEDVTEAPDTNHFYLVPVTHKELNAFYGENSPGANKAKDRFYFRNLQMPNDIAFKLARHAMKDVETEPQKTEWKQAKDLLWNSIVTVVDKFNDPETSEAYVSRQSFYDILPIHPMAAFLLKFLSESARSNQRSIFEYLKGSADGREFQEFIVKGGPLIMNRQFLTVDYLWKYFMEREDSGQSKEILGIKMEYDRIKQREFLNYEDDQQEIRVLKAVMLFTLLSRLNPEGHDRLRPTVENIELSFRGDGVIVDVDSVLRDLSDNRHCFSIVNGNIDLYASTVGNNDLEKKRAEMKGKFHELLSERCRVELEKHTKNARKGFSNERFELRVSDINHTNLTNITSITRDKFSRNLNKDDGSICLWFVVAKNKKEQMQVQEKQEALLKNLRGHRIVMLSFPNVTFCEKNVNLWEEYINLMAQYLLENNKSAKDQIQKGYVRIEKEWLDSLTSQGNAIDIRYYDVAKEAIVSIKSSWTDLKSFLGSYTKNTLEFCPDLITDQITVYNNKGLKGWALAGLRFTGTSSHAQLINSLKAQGISPDAGWFESNPSHLFNQIKALLQKKYDNTVGRGNNFSLRKAYIELQRAPYGMRYNCLSAFTLGFCLNWVLQKNCQWTNEQATRPLDETILAEIIEATVSGATDKEKFICRLSKVDKAFAQKAGLMFGLKQGDELTPLETLRCISANVEENSIKVPLWVLADYIRAERPDDPMAADILDKLCTALRISSKGDTEARNTAITEIGTVLLEHDDVINTISAFTKPDVYIAAFRAYIDKADPEIPELAKSVEDNSHAYCDMILEMSAPVAGWLWNKLDISALMRKVKYSYKVIAIVRSVLKISGYVCYEEAIKRIKDKLSNCGVPFEFIGEKYPFMTRLGMEFYATGDPDPEVLYSALNEGRDIVENLCNDPQRLFAVSLLKDFLGEVPIDDMGLATIISYFPGNSRFSFNMSTDEYLKLFQDMIARNVRSNVIKDIFREWERISGYSTVSNWTEATKMPIWPVFIELDNGNEYVDMLLNPEKLTDSVLTQKLDEIKAVPEVTVKHIQDVFLAHVVPRKYQKLNIEIGALLKYLAIVFEGKDPNEWQRHPDIDQFVKEQYQEVFSPDVLSKIRKEDAETLKSKVLKMAETDPDIGLRFLE